MKKIVLILSLILYSYQVKSQLWVSGSVTVCEGDELLLFAHGDTSYSWAKLNDPDSILSKTNYLSAFPVDTSSYLLYSPNDTLLVRTDYEGYDCICRFYVPNIFSPDGDLYNETFMPIVNCDHWGAHLTIYNRAQQVVYDENSQYPEWDGKYYKTGELMQDGLYVWQFSFLNNEGKTIRKEGYVLLMK
jgi:gliding motility-associated-like protein